MVGCSEHRNTEVDLKGKGWEGTDWIHLAQDRSTWWAVVNTVILK
jgi:hypothetical protein